MIHLTSKTHDGTLARLAYDYWALNSQGDWMYPLTDLARRFQLNPPCIPYRVRELCEAHASNIPCANCRAPAHVQSRAAYQQMLARLHQSLRSRHAPRVLCPACLQVAEQERRRQELLECERNQNALRKKLETLWCDLPSRNYSRADIKSAFLLYSLLSLPRQGDDERCLDAWKPGRPALLAFRDDSPHVYAYLSQHKWLSPSPDSRQQTVTLHSTGEISYDNSSVRWRLAKDRSNTPPALLPLVLEERLRTASRDQWLMLWHMVGLSELRQHLELTFRHFGIRTSMWSTSVRRSLRQLLDECSLAEAKRVVWISLEEVAGLLRGTHYRPAQVYGLIPECFIRALRRHGRAKTRVRPWPEETGQRALCTHILLEELLGSADQAYYRLNGKLIRTMATRPIAQR